MTKAPIESLPVNFLLTCSEQTLEDFQLMRLAAAADLRKTMIATIDRMVEELTRAALASWFRSADRDMLKRALDNPEDVIEWAKEQIRDQCRKPGMFPMPPAEPGAAHRTAAVTYQKRNIAEGKCCYCPEPQDPNSVRMCTKHLTASRTRAARKAGVRGAPGSADYLYGEITESAHGRQPGTLAALALGREKRTRALLAEMGIAPEDAAVSLTAAKEALLRCMADSPAGMTQGELLVKTLISSKSTLQVALKELLAEEKIGRTGRGAPRDLYRYALAVKS
jgi:hypothetical protein